MGSRWDESNPSPTFATPTFIPWQVLANWAGITITWEVELDPWPTWLHGPAVVKQVHQALQTRWCICHKAPHIMNQFTPHSRWFQFQLPRKGTQAQTSPQKSIRLTVCGLPAWLSTAAYEWLTILVWLAPWHNHALHTQRHFTHNSTINWYHMGTSQYMGPNLWQGYASRANQCQV